VHRISNLRKAREVYLTIYRVSLLLKWPTIFFSPVNGTLMSGLELNPNLLSAGATFVAEDQTSPVYRIFSINDRHPGMFRVNSGGTSVAVELWSVPAAGLAGILLSEPPGLLDWKSNARDSRRSTRRTRRTDPLRKSKGHHHFGGWRSYIASWKP